MEGEKDKSIPLFMLWNKSNNGQRLAVPPHRSFTFPALPGLSPLPATLLTLGLWLDRSIIMPIYRLCRKEAILFYNIGSSRSDNRLQERRNETAGMLSSWRTSHLARIYRNVSALHLCCMPLSRTLSFFKVHRLFSANPKAFNKKCLWIEWQSYDCGE